ncbi:MAG: DPP IV N-terminal domain-containing protein [Flavobacteriales bacterium]|nr:DPP IV N-terminal domain-containing protein [Flavobacteriales bacterium]
MKNYKDYLFLILGLGFTLTTVVVSNTATAQLKKFTIGEAISYKEGKLLPEKPGQLQWVQNSSNYSMVTNNTLQVFDAKSGKNVTSIGLSEIEGSRLKAYPDDKAITKLPVLTWLDANSFRYFHAGKILKFNIKTKETSKIGEFKPEEMSNSDVHPLTFKVAYVVNKNLYIDGIAITKDTDNGIQNGLAVHRNEFGITKGTFWSPEGGKLAYYHLDESMVTEYPIYNLVQRPAEARLIRYPIAGASSHHARVRVYDLKTGNTTELKTGEPLEQYLTNVTWSPDGKSIYVAIVNRRQNHMWLRSYDATTGELIRTLFEEKHEKYVEPEHGPVFRKGNNNQFIWFSERNGFNHLYLYSTKGELLKQLTSGDRVVTELDGFDKSGNKLFYTCTDNNALESHLEVVDIDKGKSSRLTQFPGTHQADLSPFGDWFMDDFQNYTTARKITLNSGSGGKEKEIYNAKDPLTEYDMGTMEVGTLKNSEGIDFNYRLIKPADFDPSRKYPVVVYLYNGPHLQLVKNSWLGGANLWMHYMAQNGYLVFTMDGRGSLNRGLEFENAVFRQLGTLEMEDQLTGVNFLKGLSYVDPERIGVHGWSFGGFMTTSLMTRKPGVFKVGVGGGPVIDWGLYEIMYTERYMDTPEENPEGYKNSNLLNYARDLKGKLLLIHGGEDDVVLWQHSLLFIEKCIKQGVQPDYFVYPDHAHNVRGKDRTHLYDKISNYFFDNL